MHIANKLKEVRLNKNFSQDYMAEVLGVSQKTYSNFENGKTEPNFKQLEKAANELGISILDFLYDDKMVFNQHNSSGSNNGIVVNNSSEKIIEQYELRIKRMDEELAYLKQLVNNLMK